MPPPPTIYQQGSPDEAYRWPSRWYVNDAATGSDADDGNSQLACHTLCQRSGNLLQYKGKASGFFQQVGVAYQLLRFGIVLGALPCMFTVRYCMD